MTEHSEVNLKNVNEVIEYVGSKCTLTSQSLMKAKKHVCQFCNKKFECKLHLKNHLLVHAKEKRYKCMFCGKLFCSKLGVKRHVKHQILTIILLQKLPFKTTNFHFWPNISSFLFQHFSSN